MRIRLRSPKDVFAGLLFVAFGAAAVLVARGYPQGTLLRMGPGYFPVALGLALIAVGLVVAARGLAADGERVGRAALRPLLFVLAAVVVFAVTIRPLGLVVATLALVLTGAGASRPLRPLETIALAVGLTAGAVALFVYALGLPFDAWPR